MSTPVRGAKLRAYLEFLAAIIFFLVARVVARQAAPGWVRDGWVPLVEQGPQLFDSPRHRRSYAHSAGSLAHSALGVW